MTPIKVYVTNTKLGNGSQKKIKKKDLNYEDLRG